MARLVFNRDGGLTNEYGHLLALNRLLSGNVFQGLNVTAATSPDMTIRVQPGTGRIPTGTSPSDYGYFVGVDTSTGESVTIATANGSNPRIDSIVGYVDLGVTPNQSQSNNSNNMLKFISVAGTPGASPSAPNSTQIQATAVGSNPYDVYANVLVGTNVTQITNSNITDVRSIASVRGTTPEIARTTLTTAGDTITVSNIPLRKYLRVVAVCMPTGGNIRIAMRVNNDSGANYASIASENNSAIGGAGLQTILNITAAAQSNIMTIDLRIVNFTVFEKLIIGEGVDGGSTGAANGDQFRDNYHKWTNITNQVNRVDILNTGTGDFAIGSEVIVYGHD